MYSFYFQRFCLFVVGQQKLDIINVFWSGFLLYVLVVVVVLPCVSLCHSMCCRAHRIYTFRMRSKRKAGMNLWNNTQGCSKTNITIVSKCVDYECVRPLYALTWNIELTNIMIHSWKYRSQQCVNIDHSFKSKYASNFLCENPWHSCYSVICRRYKTDRMVSPSSSKYFFNPNFTCGWI